MSVRLPPVAKLPLAIRKERPRQVEDKKEEIEKNVSKLLGTEWKIEADVNQFYAYATASGGYPAENPGGCLFEYFSGAYRGLEGFKTSESATALAGVNDIATAHVLTIDVDDTGKVNYCGAKVTEDGKLAVVFNPKHVGTNAGDSFYQDRLKLALSAAGPKGQLSFAAKAGITKKYEPRVGPAQDRIRKILRNDAVTLDADFGQIYQALFAFSESSDSNLRKDWEDALGFLVAMYFEGLPVQLEAAGLPKDDMVQEGIAESMDKNKIVFRIVDDLAGGSKGSKWCNCVFEDGILYLQATPKTFGNNINEAGKGIVDLL